ncbi:MAG: CRTAC1 family protein [Holophagales bacterium]|nr:CRTAC1 family protein [Holophagales bacterium]
MSGPRPLPTLLLVALLSGAGAAWADSGRGEKPPSSGAGAAATPSATSAKGAKGRAAADPESAPAIPFADVTTEAGVAWVHQSGAYGDKLLPETMGGGVALFDHDGDGDADLLLVNSTSWPHRRNGRRAGAPPASALYRNDSAGGGEGSEGIRFTDITAEAGLGLELYGMGVAVGDVDGDGDRDLFLTAVGEDRLLRNDDGSFVDVTAEAGVGGGSGEDSWSTGAGFFDADRDGDLDLFVLRYVRWSKAIDDALDFRLDRVGRAYAPPQDYRGTFPILYRNRGDGTFEDVSEAAGLRVVDGRGEPVSKGLGLLIVDVEPDGLLDVLVANDTTRNLFFRNLGSGRFEEAGEFFGLAYDRNGAATGAMGVDGGYYRNDSNLGILVGNFAAESSSVYRAQDDPGLFVDETLAEGVGAATRAVLTFGVLLLDADLDGRLDYLQVNGHVEPEIAATDATQRYRQAGQLFWNTGGWAAGRPSFRSLDAASIGALAEPMAGRGAAYADLDGDGDLDLVLTQIDGPPRVLENRQQLGHHWLRVRLKGTTGSPDAIGARVELRAGGTVQRRQVMPTRGYLGQVEPTLTFGLGPQEKVQALTVAWPDGTKLPVPVPGVDRLLVVERPADG